MLGIQLVSMRLKKLNSIEVNRLKTGDHVVDDLEVLDESIPPNHVLERATKLSLQGGDPRWAFPYLMIINNQIVGCCGFKNKPILHSVEIGYNVAPSARGKGNATLAIELLCQVAFNSSSVQRVIALISSHNIGSLNVVKNNQFIFSEMVTDDEGEELECWILNNPEYSITKIPTS